MAITVADIQAVADIKDDLSGGLGKIRKGVIAAGAAIGAAGFAAGKKWDDAKETIVRGTGASGDALDELMGTFRALAGTVKGDVAGAVADLNTAFGATGVELGDLVTDTLKAKQAFGDFDIDTLARAMKTFGLEAEDTGDFLDHVGTVAQGTGKDMDSLVGDLKTFGPVMKNAGLSAEETATFMGKLHQSGVDVTRVMPGLNQAIRRAAKEGVTDMRTHLDQAIISIRDAETDTDALRVATATFGAEGAQRMTTSIRSGILPSLSELSEHYTDSKGKTDELYESTLSLTDRFGLLKDRLAAMIGPAGNVVGVLGSVGAGVAGLAPMIAKLGKALKFLVTGPIGLAVVAVGLLVAAFVNAKKKAAALDAEVDAVNDTLGELETAGLGGAGATDELRAAQERLATATTAMNEIHLLTWDRARKLKEAEEGLAAARDEVKAATESATTAIDAAATEAARLAEEETAAAAAAATLAKKLEEEAAAAAKALAEEAAATAVAMGALKTELLGLPTDEVREEMGLLRDVWASMDVDEQAAATGRYAVALIEARDAGVVLEASEREIISAYEDTVQAQEAAREAAALMRQEEAEAVEESKRAAEAMARAAEERSVAIDELARSLQGLPTDQAIAAFELLRDTWAGMDEAARVAGMDGYVQALRHGKEAGIELTEAELEMVAASEEGFGRMKAAANDWMSSAVDAVAGFVNALATGAGSILDTLADIGRRGADALGNAMAGALSAIPVAGGLLSKLGPSLGAGLKAIGSKVWGWLGFGRSDAERAAREAAEVAAEEWRRTMEAANERFQSFSDDVLGTHLEALTQMAGASGQTWEQLNALYFEYQNARAAGDEAEMARIEELFSTLQANAETMVRSAVGAWERAQNAGQSAYESTMRAALDAGETMERAANMARDAQLARIAEVLAAEGDRLARQAAFEAALAARRAGNAAGAVDAAREAARETRLAWDTAMEAVERASSDAAEAMSQSTSEMRSSLGDVADTATAAASSMSSDFGRTTTRIRDSFRDLANRWQGNFQPPTVNAHEGTGGIRDFGAGTAATLHGREAVITQEQIERMMEAAARGGGGGISGGGGGGGGGGQTIILEVDGEAFGRAVLKHGSASARGRRY